MKKIITLAIVALLGAIAPISGSAQGLGGLIKKGQKAVEKGKKAVESVLGSESDATAQGEDSGATAFTAGGIEVINPMKASMDVEPIGLYGISRTETKGDAYLVLKVRNNTRKESALFGSSIENKKMMAADNNGNVYNIDSSGAMRYDTPEEMYVKIVMDEPAMRFQDVRKDLTVMPMVKIGISLDAQHQGNLTFKNVPIYWDVEPE